MESFEFKNPVKVVFGKGSIAKLSELVPASARVLLTYGQGSIKRNGIYDQVVKAVKPVAEFGGIEANPEYETLLKAVALCKEHNIDFILAVGGGSVLDGSKFIAAAAKWTKTAEPWDIIWRFGTLQEAAFAPEAAIPLGVVLTLPATGSETNCAAVVSYRSRKLKHHFMHPCAYPQFAVLDPAATFSLPRVQVANGLVDSFVHIMELYSCHFGVAAVQDEFSEGLLRVLTTKPLEVLDKPTYQNRADFFWATTQALYGLLSLGLPQCWTTHMIAHELTVFYGLDHGQTLAIVLPAFLRFQKDHRKDKLAQMAERVFGVHGASDMAEEAIKATERFFESVGHHTKLSKYGLDDRHFATIVAKFEGRTIAPEQNVGAAEVLAILKAAL